MPGHIKGERHATQRILGNLWEDYATAKMVTDIQIPGGKNLVGAKSANPFSRFLSNYTTDSLYKEWVTEIITLCTTTAIVDASPSVP